MYNYKGPKYMTRGIQDKIGIDIQLTLWNLIENMLSKHGPLDYLQVFKLKGIMVDGKELQEITHIQEVPPFQYTVQIKVAKPTYEKIFVIDDVEYVTMLLSSEY